MTGPAPSRAVAVIGGLVCLLAPLCAKGIAQDCAPVVAKFRQTSVRVRVEGVNRNTGAVKQSFGSGVIVSDKGHVLTNHHVVEIGTEFIDRIFHGSIGSGTEQPMPMRLIDVEPTHDLALLQFNNTAMRYQAAPIGSIESVNAGSPVCTFGYPLDLEFRPTRGILGVASGPGGWWTVDIPTNPGESGAPVFSAAGNVLGLRVAGRADAVGIYFMVPIDLAARLLAIVPKMPAIRPLLDGRVSQAQSAIRRALEFPKAVQTSRPPPTMVEGMFVNAAPLRLYEALARYDDLDVGQIPEAGEMLRSFFRRYYDFEEATGALEGEALDRIGSMVTVRFAEGWRIYLKYAVLRFGGMSAQQVSAGNDFLNYSITWSDAERVYGDLAKDPLMASRFAKVFAQHNAFLKEVETLQKLVPVPP